jgi:ParB family chromosome partitioning protein
VLQPILVRPNPDGGYSLIAGERRWRAARRAGLRTIPALVRETDDQAALEEAIVENLHRRDLNPLEEAAALQQLIADFGLTQDETARRVGKSRSAVANTLRLLSLRPAAQALVAKGSLSAGHARALLSVVDARAQERLAQEIIEGELSVRAAEQRAKELSNGGAEGSERGSGGREGGLGPTDAAERPAWALEIQDRLSDRLDTRVEVHERAGTGKIVIQFADEDDLDRIYRLLR